MPNPVGDRPPGGRPPSLSAGSSAQPGMATPAPKRVWAVPRVIVPKDRFVANAEKSNPDEDFSDNHYTSSFIKGPS